MYNHDDNNNSKSLLKTLVQSCFSLGVSYGFSKPLIGLRVRLVLRLRAPFDASNHCGNFKIDEEAQSRMRSLAFISGMDCHSAFNLVLQTIRLL